MTSMRKPYDVYSAREVMMKFTNMAYSLDILDVFQEAITILYGPEFAVKADFNKRMTFQCKICVKDMTSECSVADHYKSGAHQKNLNKDHSTSVVSTFDPQCVMYDKNTLQYQLLQSRTPPLGLQMVEEYSKGKLSPAYFKCNLCAAHGKADAMLNHLISKKHTEKYIKNRCILENSIITSNERESIRRWLVAHEGVNCSLVRRIEGLDYFPHKWVEEGAPNRGSKHMFKLSPKHKESRSPSPLPSTSRHLSSISDSSSTSQQSSEESRSPSLRSNDRPKKKYRSRRQSLDSCRKESRSPILRSSDGTRQRSLSSSRHSRERTRERELSPWESTSSRGRSSSPSLNNFRNKSPPVISQRVRGSLRKEVDCEDVLKHFTFITKTHHMVDSAIVTEDDAKATVDLMYAISKVLYNLAAYNLEAGPDKERQVKNMAKLCGQIVHKLKNVYY